MIHPPDPASLPCGPLEETAGLVEVKTEKDGGVTIAAPQPLSLGPEMPADLLAGCVGIAPAEIVSTAHRPVMASVGNSFVVAEVTPEALTRAAPDLARFRERAAFLTDEEYEAWERLYARHGSKGLRTTRLQQYRR
mgnify:CR=1 FL=1